jgi:hypothetical protein
MTQYDELWAGVALKLEHAAFHLRRMEQSLEPPERTAINVALQASGAILDTGWQRSFYAHLDAFLSAARSAPEIVQCCFGVDERNHEMKTWFEQLPSDEKTRRNRFKNQFEPAYKSFRALRLGTLRNISEHRTGFAPAAVTISGLFGVTYIGSAVKPIPLTEARPGGQPDFPWMDRPIPVPLPRWDHFELEGRPLFPACQEYLNGAQDLVNTAHQICDVVHGNMPLSFPPS